MHVALEMIQILGKVLYAFIESFILLMLPSDLRTKKSIVGDVALVTGAGSGIGRLISIRLARLGAKLVLWDISGDGIEVTKQLIVQEGGIAHTYVCDVTDRELVYRTANTVRSDVGDVSILVNNAGIVSGKSFLETPDEKLQKTMDVNVIAHFWTLKAFLPQMINQNRGHIVTISSSAGKCGASKLVDYCASKFAATGLHEALSQELLDTDIHMTNICPFFINTGMFEGYKSRFPALLPGLEPEAVADRIAVAIQLNEHEVLIPSRLSAIIILNALLPRKAAQALSDLLGIREMMASFVGRDGAAN